jgi:UDP-glucose 4-epimerase
MVVLITGGTGFLGSALAHYLVLEQGLPGVVLFDHYPHPEAVADIADRVTIVRGDLLELSEIVAAVRRNDVDCIAHMGFAAGVPARERVLAYLRSQCLGTANVFETARLLGIRRVVNASSVAVWGDRTERPVTEDAPARPRNVYGSNKLWSEHLAEFYNTEHDMEIISLRICAVFGYGRVDRMARLAAAGLTAAPGPRPHYLTNPELVTRGVAVTMPPDDQMADFLYAPDNSMAWWLALTANRTDHRLFNLRGDQRPAGDMTRYLRRLVPAADIIVADEPVDLDQIMDNTRIVTELGFTPRYTLETAIEDYIAKIEAAQA